MGDEQIRILTGKEEIFAGGTPGAIYKDRPDSDWDIPEAVLLRLATVEQVNERRKERGFYNAGAIGAAFLKGIPPEGTVVGFVFESLSADGRTSRDPRIIHGVWDGDTKKITSVIADLTDQAVELLEGEGFDLHLRPEPRTPEGGRPGFERK